MKTLPDDGKLRKNYPIGSGALAYFPAAIAGVARHSYISGAKYNDGALLHLRWMGGNNMDCIDRHMMDIRDLLAARDRGATETKMWVYNFDLKQEEFVTVPIEDAILVECNALSWRALATSQELHEKLASKPLAPAARLSEAPPVVPAPLPQIRVHSYTEGKKVAVIKAIREIGGYSLKAACDLVQGDYPFTMDCRIAVTNARRLLTAAGAHIE